MADIEAERIDIEEFLARKREMEQATGSSAPIAPPPTTNKELAQAYLYVKGGHGKVGKYSNYQTISRGIAAVELDICEFYRENGTLEGFAGFKDIVVSRTKRAVIGRITCAVLEEILRDGPERVRQRVCAQQEEHVCGNHYVDRKPHRIKLEGEDSDDPTFHNAVRLYER